MSFIETDLGFIKYDINIFNKLLEENFELNNDLIKKSNDLVANYNCFISNYDAKSLWEKKKLIAQKKHTKSSSYRSKPHVLLIDFSDEMKCKKEFTSYLNKLTDINKEIIYKKISSFILDINNDIIKNSLFDVLINFIKNSSNSIYIEVLYLFDKSFIELNIKNYLNKYIKNKEWLPNEIKIENKILFNNENYDLYCIYVKYKKNCLSILKALILISNKLSIDINLVEYIYNDLIIYIDQIEYKHIIELLLDELIIIFEYININIDTEKIKEELLKINLEIYEYSTRFKFKKILEIK